MDGHEQNKTKLGIKVETIKELKFFTNTDSPP